MYCTVFKGSPAKLWEGDEDVWIPEAEAELCADGAVEAGAGPAWGTGMLAAALVEVPSVAGGGAAEDIVEQSF